MGCRIRTLGAAPLAASAKGPPPGPLAGVAPMQHPESFQISPVLGLSRRNRQKLWPGRAASWAATAAAAHSERAAANRSQLSSSRSGKWNWQAPGQARAGVIHVPPAVCIQRVIVISHPHLVTPAYTFVNARRSSEAREIVDQSLSFGSLRAFRGHDGRECDGAGDPEPGRLQRC